MSAANWSGPYCSAQAGTGDKLDWNPLGDRHPPRGAVKFVVRWRVTGFTHPRKRTFTDAAAAEEWARRIEAARVMRSGCDGRGWPAGAVPVDGQRHADGGAAPLAVQPGSADQSAQVS